MKPVLNIPDFGILRSVEKDPASRELICRRVTSLYYITDDHKVGEIAAIFISDPSLQALAVTDTDRKVLGIIIRSELFSLIGQMFGRELYSSRNISYIIRPVETIYYKRNTFSVVDQISENLASAHNRFYVLVDADSRYRGLFSSFDIVLFLSEMMTRELKAAQRIHSVIVKDAVSMSTSRAAISGSAVMAGESGGDFLYVRRLGNSRLFISLCDVSGKGLNAGLISVAVTSMYAAYDFTRGIRELICRINSYIYSFFEGEIFLTGVFIDFDYRKGTLDVYDMGHSMIYLVRDGGISNPFDNNNIPLGIKKELIPVKSGLKLLSGDYILSYTDGFPEQNNLADEEFGEERLHPLVVGNVSMEPEEMRDFIFNALGNWRTGNAQGDDMSILILKYR